MNKRVKVGDYVCENGVIYIKTFSGYRYPTYYEFYKYFVTETIKNNE